MRLGPKASKTIQDIGGAMCWRRFPPLIGLGVALLPLRLSGTLTGPWPLQVHSRPGGRARTLVRCQSGGPSVGLCLLKCHACRGRSRWFGEAVPSVRGQAGFDSGPGADELLVQNLTGMERGQFFRSHDGLLMVIHDLDAVGIPILPEETNPPLIVDPDAVLAFAGTFQSLKTVGRWCLQIFKDRRYRKRSRA